MTRPRRIPVGFAAAVSLAVLAACTPSTTATIPTIATSSATPSATPSVTYGPNQTAALAAVTGYYAWWNRARKNPRDPQFLELPKYVDVAAQLSATTMGDTNGLATLGYRQEGDMVVTNAAVDGENSTKITVTVCLDRTSTHLVNSAGMTVDPRDSRTGATIPASEVFTKRAYTLITKPHASGGWWITDLAGGASTC